MVNFNRLSPTLPQTSVKEHLELAGVKRPDEVAAALWDDWEIESIHEIESLSQENKEVRRRDHLPQT